MNTYIYLYGTNYTESSEALAVFLQMIRWTETQVRNSTRRQFHVAGPDTAKSWTIGLTD